MLILASKSPRRNKLLKRIYPFPFKVVPSNADEETVKADKLEDLPLKISLLKGKSVSDLYKDDYVLAADTIVILDNVKFGKPKDEKDAIRMLKALNNKVHSIVTGYAIFKGGELLKNRLVTSQIIINDMDDQAISAYIKTGSPFDKAGAYGIQDTDYVHSKIIKGTKENVMGFPIIEIREDLINLKLI